MGTRVPSENFQSSIPVRALKPYTQYWYEFSAEKEQNNLAKKVFFHKFYKFTSAGKSNDIKRNSSPLCCTSAPYPYNNPYNMN
jgi:phosphodiesterase/alkaline phosphatase D-like protein